MMASLTWHTSKMPAVSAPVSSAVDCRDVESRGTSRHTTGGAYMCRRAQSINKSFAVYQLQAGRSLCVLLETEGKHITQLWVTLHSIVLRLM
eukprot:COSAG02_NODE_6574_length_3486_cov_2.401240_4_plen_92_part_00